MYPLLKEKYRKKNTFIKPLPQKIIYVFPKWYEWSHFIFKNNF